MTKRIAIFATIAFLVFSLLFIWLFTPMPIFLRKPHFLSSQTQTIEVQYVDRICKADFIETNKFKSDPIVEGKTEGFIFIEPSELAPKLDSNFYATSRFLYKLRLTGSFYLTKGAPEPSYPEIIECWPERSRVFRYHNIEFSPK